MSKRVLLTTTSFQDTPGTHQDLLNSQDWEVIRARGPLSEDEMLDLSGNFDAFLCGDDSITQAVIDKSLPRLQIISKYGIGLDKINVDYATKKALPVLFTPGVNHTTVAEHTFGLLLGITKDIQSNAVAVQNGEWVAGWKKPVGNEIMGKTIGILGLGRIGKEVAIRARAFGMSIIAFDPYFDDSFASENGVKRCSSMNEVLNNSDVVSLHCFLNDETEDMINAAKIAEMRDQVIVLNCARGELVNTKDMADALKSGKVGGYGADVLDAEPPAPGHVLIGAPNCIITSHIGSRTHESVQRQANRCLNNAINFFSGAEDVLCANGVL
ncbi:phosphoglycerate dehydrogenase [Akkermansiaceae bacterium]|nr:phosphoglycerate dehydrogenase [Akkermansiaceae bacterium]MDA7875443.1 phosphoglycerate dehydrogenase [Akkermansiaceae bacterium]MDA7908577.1 phosphoglycerate dehydrogenase [Akkermansiaceae bacterium]MDB4417989.1 phosphoglycerate dehydrogenase [Akkermansiaceae bacterium]MDB4672095.1 phosphoglycerate dehydrogenase [Akkermansiaceae bacterium]